MHHFRKLFILSFLFAVVAAIPFLILGESFEEQIKNWFTSDWSDSQRFSLIVGLLAVDIAIPIPSSAVSTYGGAVLGFIPATVASWIGMMLGSLSGFWGARILGPRLVSKFSKAEDLESLERLNKKISLWIIAVARPLPILAEASILLLGSLRLPWTRLLLPLSLSNLVIAAAYSAIGYWSVERDITFYVVLASMFFPLLLTWLVRRQLHSLFSDSTTSRVKP